MTSGYRRYHRLRQLLTEYCVIHWWKSLGRRTYYLHICGLQILHMRTLDLGIAAWMELRYVGHGILNGPLVGPHIAASCAPIVSWKLPLLSRLSLACAIQFTLYYLATKLHFVYEAKTFTSASAFRACHLVYSANRDYHSLHHINKVEICLRNIKFGRAVCSRLGIHFRVSRKVKWTRQWCNWNSDVSEVRITPFTYKISIGIVWHNRLRAPSLRRAND